MNNLDEAINRIKRLECPAGDVDLRIMGILEGYDVVNSKEAEVKRDEDLDRDEAEAYRVKLNGNLKDEFVVLAKSGADDYVAKVIDVYKR